MKSGQNKNSVYLATDIDKAATERQEYVCEYLVFFAYEKDGDGRYFCMGVREYNIEAPAEIGITAPDFFVCKMKGLI